jgi:hypothetical protein
MRPKSPHQAGPRGSPIALRAAANRLTLAAQAVTPHDFLEVGRDGSGWVILR